MHHFYIPQNLSRIMLSEVKQVTIVISGKVQFIGLRGYIEELTSEYDLAGFVYNDFRDGTVKLACEGEASSIDELAEEIRRNPEVRVEIRDKILLPKPAGRVVVGVERDIFSRLDLGVERLGSIDSSLASVKEHTASMDGKLGSMDGKLGSMDGKLGSMDGKLGSMEGSLSSMEVKLR
ncbi:MAG: acylphosphatase, partial [Methanobacteriota archaeon]